MHLKHQRPFPHVQAIMSLSSTCINFFFLFKIHQITDSSALIATYDQGDLSPVFKGNL